MGQKEEPRRMRGGERGAVRWAACLLLSGCVPVPIPGKIQVSPEVHGRVIDRSTRRLLQGATVMFKEDVAGKVRNRSSTETDADGRFTAGPEQHRYRVVIFTACPVHYIPKSPPYAWLLQIDKPGYGTKDIDLRHLYYSLTNNVLHLGDVELDPLGTANQPSEGTR